MTITARNQLIDALGNNSSPFVIDKATLTAQLAGVYASMWRSTGQPAQGAIPSTPAICTSATLGAIPFLNQTSPATSYIAHLFAAGSNNSQSLEIHDRLVHNGGLSFNVNTAQTITGLDINTLAVPAARFGNINFSDIQWWLEVYTAGGATASNATINVTFDDASTGNLNVLSVGGTLGASRMYGLNQLRTAGQQNRFIRGINSVTLSAATGVVGSFGFTATRPRTILSMPVAGMHTVADWATLGFPNVPNDSCLMLLVMPSTTSTGTIRGGGKIAHG